MMNVRGKEMTHLHSSSHPFPRLLSKEGAGSKRRNQGRSQERGSQAQARAALGTRLGTRLSFAAPQQDRI